MSVDIENHKMTNSGAPKKNLGNKIANAFSKLGETRSGKEEERAPSTILTKIVAASVMLVIGFAGGVIFERAISSPEDKVVAQTEGPIEEGALMTAPSEDTMAPQPETSTEEKQPEEKQSEEKQPEVKPAEEVKENNAPVSTVAENKPVAYDALSAEEKADMKYLKSSDTWSSSKVKSQRFKNMFAQLNGGNIDCLDAAFGSYERDYVNGYVVNIISSIKKLSPENKEKAKKYLREDDGGEIKMSWAASQIGKMAK